MSGPILSSIPHHSRLSPENDFDSLPLGDLLPFLRDEERAIRFLAIRTIAESNQPGAIPYLLEAVADPDVEFAAAARAALPAFRGRDAVGPLTEGVAHRVPEVRAAAVAALRDHRTPRALPALRAALDDADAIVRQEAVLTLAEIQDEQVWPLLRLALFDGAQEVRRAAVAAVGHLRAPRTLPYFLSALQDVDWGVRVEAASALGSFPETESVEALRRALRDQHPQVIARAIVSLGRLRAPFSEEIAHFLSHIVPEVRAAAVKVLGEIGDHIARLRLTLLVGDREIETARIAQAALARLDSTHQQAA